MKKRIVLIVSVLTLVLLIGTSVPAMAATGYLAASSAAMGMGPATSSLMPCLLPMIIARRFHAMGSGS